MANVCNYEELRRFVLDYDPISERYMRFTNFQYKKEELRGYLDKLQRTEPEEKWNLEEIEDTYLTVKKVYGEGNDELCEIVECATEKFLSTYVDIEGACQLFKSSYFYFEWMMHLEYNKDRHEYTYYRDHYVHQVRNLYEMFIFLDKLKFEERCRKIYQGLDNEVGRMIRKSIVEEIENMPGVEKKIWKILDIQSDRMENILYRYLFHASAIMASLLHDIGYPIRYIGKTVSELGGFLPFTNLFIEEVETLATVHSVLQDSLLYRIVGQKEVAAQVKGRDHGALSAVVLLYKYYDNGKIAGLSPIKRAVIELSAVMIYNHTMKFVDMGAKKGHYYKNMFRDNPMSYLFRLCDDLQEWNRSYFEISSRSNFFVCGECYMPLVFDKRKKVQGQREYSCWCGECRGINTTTFAYRRLFNVDACSELRISPLSVSGKTGRECLTVRVQYNKSKLLQLAAYSPNYALKRAEGMREVKRMLWEQPAFPDTFLDFFVSNNPVMLKAEIVADWFTTAGKDLSFSRYEKRFKGRLGKKEFTKQKECFEPIMDQMKTDAFRGDCEEDRKKLEEWIIRKKADKDKNKEKKPWNENAAGLPYMWNKFYFYYCLALWGRLLGCIEKTQLLNGKNEIATTARFLRALIGQSFGIGSREEKDLVEYYLKHKLLQYNKNQYEEIRCEEEWTAYFDTFTISPEERDAVQGYVNSPKYEELKEKVQKEKGDSRKRNNVDIEKLPIYYDYYSDYYLYYTIAAELESA